MIALQLNGQLMIISAHGCPASRLSPLAEPSLLPLSAKQTLSRTYVGLQLMVFSDGRGADLCAQLYLRELKTYKAPQVGAKDAEGHVQVRSGNQYSAIGILKLLQKFAVPSAPKSPEEADLANDLKTYETQAVDVEGSSRSAEGGEQAVEELDWFEPEEEAPAAAAH